MTGLTEGVKKLWVKTVDNVLNVTTAATAEIDRRHIYGRSYSAYSWTWIPAHGV